MLNFVRQVADEFPSWCVRLPSAAEFRRSLVT